MDTISKENFQDYEKILASEGLGDIDILEGFQEVRDKIHHLGNITGDDLSRVSEEYGVKFELNESTLYIYNTQGEMMGYIRPGHYTYKNISHSDHIEKVIFDEFRGKGYGQLMYDVYKALGNHTPQNECTHKASVVLFLLANRYEIIGKYDDNAILIPLTEQEKYQLEYDLKKLIAQKDSDLPFSYVLQKN